MSNKPSDSLAHPYEPEPYPILNARSEFWWMPEWEKTVMMDALARQYGGEGYLPRLRAGIDQEYER
jgi:hypothetical protein